VSYGTLSQSMSFVELLIPPAALLKLFEATSVSTGMTQVAPGGATLVVGGMHKSTQGALPNVPVVLTCGSCEAINLLSIWLSDKLKRANLQHILINGAEIECTAEAIANTISEATDVERDLIASAEATTITEAEIISSKDAIVCLRVPPDVDMKLYVQGSAIQKCSMCESEVLVAPSSQVILAEGKNEIVCMECWTQAHPPEMSPDERGDKLCKLLEHKFAGEQAYDDMYEKAHSSSDATAFYCEAKDSFYAAIGLARELGLEHEVEQLDKRLAHIKSVFRSQFS
jgi:hypothetical protein